jgi:hypothetical protein
LKNDRKFFQVIQGGETGLLPMEDFHGIPNLEEKSKSSFFFPTFGLWEDFLEIRNRNVKRKSFEKFS